ncbi:MAG: serine hydroxymethyltransferase [Legionellales bacterium]|nr:serine hydroxymethyltransferase [Legionellales bacterium]
MNRVEQLKSFDPEIYTNLIKESKRQDDQINLIASENYVSPIVHLASQNALTNKYAEGYSHKRYYAGCEFADNVEDIAIDRANQLFSSSFANVQPHSGSQANHGVFNVLLNPGDTILGMDLNHGGHLTHGCSVNFSGKVYNAVAYGVDQNGQIDYDQVADIAKKSKPKLIIAGFSAYSGILDWKKFRAIADQVGAYFLADIAHVSGLIAGGVYPNPIEDADVLTSTTHKSLRGPRGGIMLAKRNPDLFKSLNFGLFPGVQGGPMMHIVAAKAVAFKEALTPEFVEYQKQILKNAKAMVEVFLQRGVQVVSGKTENHLVLLDLTNTSFTGKDMQSMLEAVGIITNKNTVPNEQRSPFVTSGIRIGTPAMTTRGMKENEAKHIANLISDIALTDYNEDKIKTEVSELTKAFPVETDYLI